MTVFARIIVATLLSVSVSPCMADVIMLSAAADAFIIENISNNNAGGQDFVVSGKPASANLVRRSLVQFDLTGVAGLGPGAAVNSVQLDWPMVFNTPAGAASTFDLHRLTASWTEGTGAGSGGPNSENGRPAINGEVTWNSRMHNVNAWTSSGGDFAAAVSASSTIPVTNIATYTFSGAGLVTDIQNMVDNINPNNGWILRSQSEGTFRSARRWGSREGGMAAQLTINFTPVPEPAAWAMCLLVGFGFVAPRVWRRIRN